MTRMYLCLLALAFAGLSACNGEKSESPAAAAQEPVTEAPITDSAEMSWRDQKHQAGRETFQEYCASCHEQDAEEAPRIRDSESWANRSPLWSAVLLEHAKNGYMNMQAKGGEPGLSDSEVEAAGEFMLSETFPELPRD